MSKGVELAKNHFATMCALLALSFFGQAVAAAAAKPDLRAVLMDLMAADQQVMREKASGAAGEQEARVRLQANVSRLKALVEAHGWPTISAVGADGAQAAWLVAQHADHDPAFQHEALKHMTALVPAGEVNRADVAMLTDRVAVADRKPQPFGTQGGCGSQGRFEPFAIAEPEQVDARRAAWDLEPLPQYVDRASRHMCSGGVGQ